jgi:tetratricopeptide (TPR) repeat protein
MTRLSLALWFLALIAAHQMAAAPQAATAPRQAPAASPPPAGSQSKAQPKAKSQEEFQAFQKFMQAQNPDEQIRLVEDFLLQYPQSALKEFAFQTATQAYQAKNDYPRVLTYGEMTLAENQDNLVALLILASAIPERTGKDDADRDERLSDAERYAARGLEVLAKLPKPSDVPGDQWERSRKETESAAHGALGMVAMIREDLRKAEFELKEAADLASRPDPILLYRLGLCFSLQKKYDLALEILERASSSGGVKITAPDGSTRDLVAEAREFNLKAKAASGAPASPPAGASQ